MLTVAAVAASDACACARFARICADMPASLAVGAVVASARACDAVFAIAAATAASVQTCGASASILDDAQAGPRRSVRRRKRAIDDDAQAQPRRSAKRRKRAIGANICSRPPRLRKPACSRPFSCAAFSCACGYDEPGYRFTNNIPSIPKHPRTSSNNYQPPFATNERRDEPAEHLNPFARGTQGYA